MPVARPIVAWSVWLRIALYGCIIVEACLRCLQICLSLLPLQLDIRSTIWQSDTYQWHGQQHMVYFPW